MKQVKRLILLGLLVWLLISIVSTLQVQEFKEIDKQELVKQDIKKEQEDYTKKDMQRHQEE